MKFPWSSDSSNAESRSPRTGKESKTENRKSWVFGSIQVPSLRALAGVDHGPPSGSDSYNKNRSSSHTDSIGDAVTQSPRADSVHSARDPAHNDRSRQQPSGSKGKSPGEKPYPHARPTGENTSPSSTTHSSHTRQPTGNGATVSGQRRVPPPSGPARSTEESSGSDARSDVDDAEVKQRTDTRQSESVRSPSAHIPSSTSPNSAKVTPSRSRSNYPESQTKTSSRSGHTKGEGRDSMHRDLDILRRRLKDTEDQLAEQKRTRAEEKLKLQNQLNNMGQELQGILTREKQQTEALRRDAQQHISLLTNQCAQHAGEAERLKAALQAASTLSETRAKELSSAKAFLAVVDDSSGADVVKSVNSLNDQVLQFSAQFMDMAEIRDVETDIAVDEVGPQILEAKECLRELFGDQVDELFNLPIDQLEYASQCALQAILLRWCTKVIHAWSLYPEVDNALKEIYGGIQRSISDPALQTIATRWRALTRAQSRANWEAESQITECVTKDVMSLLVLVCGARPLSAKEQAQREKRTYDKISDILKLAFQISKVIGEGITSADYELVYPLPGELFDVDSMVDDNEIEGQSESPVQIICTCQLGLLRIQPGAPSRYQILTKARVFLPSALSQF
ncbi:hypothetical protein VKT23_000205 [Stygiomarasmius scandens]|uniref:Uncharacterized protein n=1 Tax=Marasmiellus scandens TaxID=2682957 RepID=A0ABR1K5B6_9AGAR